MGKLDKRTVLILNKHWIPINTTTPKHAFGLLYCENAKAINISPDVVEPLSWSEWILIKPKPEEDSVKILSGEVRIPSVIVMTYFDKIPRQSAKFTIKNIWERDNYTCQYTGKKLTKESGNIDHVVPRAKGGKSSWENCVIAHKDVNSKKGDRFPEEAGLSLIRKPFQPKTMPVSFYIKNEYNIKDWETFLTSR